LVFTAGLRPQVRMPPVWNARRMSCPIPSSECAQIPNFRTRSIPNLWTRPMSSFWTYLFAARLCHTSPATNGVVCCATGTPQHVLVLAASTRCLRRAHSIGRGCRVHTCVMVIGADFKMYLLCQFCSNQVKFFYNTQETQTNDGPEFWNSNSVIFEIFNFQKGVARSLCGQSGPLWSRPN